MTMCEALHFLRTLVDPMNKSKAKVAMEKQKLVERNEEDQSVDFVFLPEVRETTLTLSKSTERVLHKFHILSGFEDMSS